MNRRALLTSLGFFGTSSLTGCLGVFEESSEPVVRLGHITARNRDSEPRELALTLTQGETTLLDTTYQFEAAEGTGYPDVGVEYDDPPTTDPVDIQYTVPKTGETKLYTVDEEGCNRITVEITEGGLVSILAGLSEVPGACATTTPQPTS